MTLRELLNHASGPPTTNPQSYPAGDDPKVSEEDIRGQMLSARERRPEEGRSVQWR